MQRWDIINFFMAKRERPEWISYLELGYYKGWSFDQTSFCSIKDAVDPNPSKTPLQESWDYGTWNILAGGDSTAHTLYKMTSDEFFNRESTFAIGEFDTELPERRKWDIIFIDGQHEHHQVLRDLRNSFKHLREGGIIIMHDCNPTEYLHTTVGIDGNWTGNVYKAMLDLRNSREAEAYVVDTDWGVGIVRPVREGDKAKDITDAEHLNAISDWEYFSQNRKKLLGLVDISTFLAKERNKDEKVQILT